MKKQIEIAKDIAKIMQREHLEDEKELRDWLKNSNYASELINHLTDEKYLTEQINSIDKNEGIKQSFLLKQEIDRRIRHRKMIRISSITFAAAVICLSFLLFYNHSNNTIKPNSFIVAETKIGNDVTVPTIILNNGKKINPTEEDIIETKNYIGDDTIVNREKELLNKFIVPSRFASKIKLSDGTIVHLNANSELSYPMEFNSDERSVELKGEAFFEVTSSNVPFVVKTKNTNIKVYGTKFNINSYDEKNIKTLLIEGKVGISFNDSKSEQILKPNQLAISNVENGECTVSNVSPDKYISWIIGFFRYDSDNLVDLISDLSRWYDVKFQFKNENDKNTIITSSFKKDLPIEEILGTIEKAIDLKFTKEKGVYVIESL